VNTTNANLIFPSRIATVAERLDWGTNTMWDAAEGAIGSAELALAAAMLVGWADLASDAERAQYLALSRQMTDLATSM
jgi:hypothetical protein